MRMARLLKSTRTPHTCGLSFIREVHRYHHHHYDASSLSTLRSTTTSALYHPRSPSSSSPLPSCTPMSGRATIAFCCRRARLTSLRAPGSASHVHRTSTASFHCTSSRSPHRSFLLRRTPSPPTFTLPVRSFNSTRIRQLHLPSPATASSIQITDSSPDPHPWSLPSSVQHSHDEIDPNAKESHHALHPALHLTPLPLTADLLPPLPCPAVST